jgi:hypothetical protein
MFGVIVTGLEDTVGIIRFRGVFDVVRMHEGAEFRPGGGELVVREAE